MQPHSRLKGGHKHLPEGVSWSQLVFLIFCNDCAHLGTLGRGGQHGPRQRIAKLLGHDGLTAGAGARYAGRLLPGLPLSSLSGLARFPDPGLPSTKPGERGAARLCAVLCR